MQCMFLWTPRDFKPITLALQGPPLFGPQDRKPQSTQGARQQGWIGGKGSETSLSETKPVVEAVGPSLPLDQWSSSFEI